MLTTFEQIFEELRSRGARKRMVAAWGVDSHTIAAASKAIDLGLADVILVGDEALIAKACNEEGVDVQKFTIVHNPNELQAVAQAVQMIREGQGDFLMKGLCSTDKFLRAVLNKETGLLPPKGILTHCISTILNNAPHLIYIHSFAMFFAPNFLTKSPFIYSSIFILTTISCI